MKRYIVLLMAILSFSQLCHSTNLFGLEISKDRQQTLALLEEMGFEKAVVTNADGDIVANETDKSTQLIGSLFNRLVTADVLYGEDPSTIKMVKISFKYFDNSAEMLAKRQTALDDIDRTHGAPTYHFTKTAMTADDTAIMSGRFGSTEKVPTLYDLWITPNGIIELATTPDNTEFYASCMFQ